MTIRKHAPRALIELYNGPFAHYRQLSPEIKLDIMNIWVLSDSKLRLLGDGLIAWLKEYHLTSIWCLKRAFDAFKWWDLFGFDAPKGQIQCSNWEAYDHDKWEGGDWTDCPIQRACKDPEPRPGEPLPPEGLTIPYLPAAMIRENFLEYARDLIKERIENNKIFSFSKQNPRNKLIDSALEGLEKEYCAKVEALYSPELGWTEPISRLPQLLD